MPFFNNAKDFTVAGGNFTAVEGNLHQNTTINNTHNQDSNNKIETSYINSGNDSSRHHAGGNITRGGRE